MAQTGTLKARQRLPWGQSVPKVVSGTWVASPFLRKPQASGPAPAAEGGEQEADGTTRPQPGRVLQRQPRVPRGTGGGLSSSPTRATRESRGLTPLGPQPPSGAPPAGGGCRLPPQAEARREGARSAEGCPGARLCLPRTPAGARGPVLGSPSTDCSSPARRVRVPGKTICQEDQALSFVEPPPNEGALPQDSPLLW